jgi:hypothetical protein
MTSLLYFFAGAFAMGCLMRVYQKITDMQAKIEKLEKAQQVRVNYKSLEEIENAMAELAVYDMDLDLQKERVRTIRHYLSKAHTPTSKEKK